MAELTWRDSGRADRSSTGSLSPEAEVVCLLLCVLKAAVHQPQLRKGYRLRERTIYLISVHLA